MGERIRILEGLHQSRDVSLADAQLRAIPEIPEDIIGVIAPSVPRNIRRLASGYRWESPLQRGTFEKCATQSVERCLQTTSPAGVAIDPGIRSVLVGTGLGLAMARGGGWIAAGIAGLWLMRGRGLLQ